MDLKATWEMSTRDSRILYFGRFRSRSKEPNRNFPIFHTKVPV
jgi:hypothetical protein